MTIYYTVIHIAVREQNSLGGRTKNLPECSKQNISKCIVNGVGRKFSRGGQRKTDLKITKNGKIALFSLFQGWEGATEKRPKKTLFSLYLYLYHG